jgi:hypothetical protein
MGLDYKAWVKGAKERLAVLESQRDAIDMEIAALEQSIRAFEPLISVPQLTNPEQDQRGPHPSSMPASNLGWLTGIPSYAEYGLTEAIRTAIKSSNRPLETTEIRDLIVANGFDLTGRSNAMANVHQVLRRLESQGEIRQLPISFDPTSITKHEGIETVHGKVRFEWVGSKAVEAPTKSILNRLRRPTMPPPEELPELTNPEDEQKRKK